MRRELIPAVKFRGRLKILCMLFVFVTGFWIAPVTPQAVDVTLGATSLIAGKGAPDSTASPRFIGDGGLASQAQLINPFDAVADYEGNVFVLDTSHQRIRKVNPAGFIETIAGTGYHGFATDQGRALAAHFADPVGLTIDKAGNVYVADTFNHCIRRITSQGHITTIAGTGISGYDGDGGLAVQAQLSGPTGLFWAGNGVLYVADQGNHRIRAISTDGRINTLVGTGHSGFGGDGGLAIHAQLADPSGVFVGGDGCIYIADRSNHRIRKVNKKGVIETLAGTGVLGFGGDGGLAIDAQLAVPSRVVVDANGLVYFADRGNNRIRRIDPLGRMHTVVGSAGELKRPFGLSLSPLGELLISDTENHVVRKTNGTDRWLSLIPDRLEILSNGKDRVTFLSQISGNPTGIPVHFNIVQGQGIVSVGEAISVNGLVGTQFYTQTPGRVILEATTPNALPVSVELNVLPIYHLTVSQSHRRFVANGSNWATIGAQADPPGQELSFVIVQGEAELMFENGQARLRTGKPGHIVVEVAAVGALPVSVDIWAVAPKVWQIPDAFEPDDAPLILQSGDVIARSFHNDGDVDWIQLDVPAGHALHLDANQAIMAEVFSADGEFVNTFSLPGDIFADAHTRQFRVALTGAEGGYELTATQRATGTLKLVLKEDVFVADGQSNFAVALLVQDRFGHLRLDDDAPRAQLIMTAHGREVGMVESTVQEGVGEFLLVSNISGEIKIDAIVPGLEPISTVVHARPALMLREASDSPSGFVDILLVAGSGLLGATGIQARMAYDPQHFRFESFSPLGAMVGATPLLASVIDGAVEVNVALLGERSAIDGGIVGRVRFGTIGQAERAREFVLLEGKYGGPKGILPFGIGAITGRVQVGETPENVWEEMQASFGSSKGQVQYVPAFDVDGNGHIDFADFLLWLTAQQD